MGPKPRKKQQVYIKNPQDYIIPQSTVNSALHDRQQSVNVEKQGATKTFANDYGGTGDNRSFVWTAKPQPPVATPMANWVKITTETWVLHEEESNNERIWKQA